MVCGLLPNYFWHLLIFVTRIFLIIDVFVILIFYFICLPTFPRHWCSTGTCVCLRVQHWDVTSAEHVFIQRPIFRAGLQLPAAGASEGCAVSVCEIASLAVAVGDDREHQQRHGAHLWLVLSGWTDRLAASLDSHAGHASPRFGQQFNMLWVDVPFSYLQLILSTEGHQPSAAMLVHVWIKIFDRTN